MAVDDDSTSPDRLASQREAADYIATLAAELAALAGAQKLTTLRYLLEMARQEADQIAHHPDEDD